MVAQIEMSMFLIKTINQIKQKCIKSIFIIIIIITQYNLPDMVMKAKDVLSTLRNTPFQFSGRITKVA